MIDLPGYVLPGFQPLMTHWRKVKTHVGNTWKEMLEMLNCVCVCVSVCLSVCNGFNYQVPRGNVLRKTKSEYYVIIRTES